MQIGEVASGDVTDGHTMALLRSLGQHDGDAIAALNPLQTCKLPDFSLRHFLVEEHECIQCLAPVEAETRFTEARWFRNASISAFPRRSGWRLP